MILDAVGSGGRVIFLFVVGVVNFSVVCFNFLFLEEDSTEVTDDVALAKRSVEFGGGFILVEATIGAPVTVVSSGDVLTGNVQLSNIGDAGTAGRIAVSVVVVVVAAAIVVAAAVAMFPVCTRRHSEWCGPGDIPWRVPCSTWFVDMWYDDWK